MNMSTNRTFNFNPFSNDSSQNTTKKFQSYNMKNRIETARIIVYSLIILIAFLGNGLLVTTITFTKKMKTTTNYFLLNLAIGDLLIAVLCAPYQLASWNNPSIKTFNEHVCKAMPFIQMSAIGTSIYTMIIIALDRFLAVTTPLRPHISSRSRVWTIIVVWLASILTASPMIFVYQVKARNISESNHVVNKIQSCGEYGWANPKKDAAAYTYALFALEYAVPGLLVGFLYLRIILHLWYHNIPGMQNLPKAALVSLRKKHYRRKKTVFMLVTVFLTFMICNLPMHVLTFIFYVQGPKFKPPPYMSVIATFAEMLMYANSALNPILYGFLHNKFSTCAIGLMKWIFCSGRRPNYEMVQPKRNNKRVTFNSGDTKSSVWANKNGDQRRANTKV